MGGTAHARYIYTMPISFTLDRIEIERFRGIEHLSLDLMFGIPTYLIGGNNSGKSTVINAIALALKGGGFYAFTPSKYDFYHAPSGIVADDFTITIRFKAASEYNLPAVHGVGSPVLVHGIRVVGEREDNRYSHRHLLIGADDKPIAISNNLPLKGEAKDKFKDHGINYRKHYVRIDDIQQHLPEVWLLSPSNLDNSLYHWKRGPLQRLAALLSKQFLETPWTFTAGGKNHPMPDSLMRAHSFFKTAVKDFPFWKDTLKPRLEASMSKCKLPLISGRS
ncbi:MAG: DUF2813 domain-containing protein [Flavobacteriales bacterium]|nr:DUF2813 domain-containing protein [Flavobacteriales bacterium]